MTKLIVSLLLLSTFSLAAEKKSEPEATGMFKEEISSKMAAIEKKLHLLDQKISSTTTEAKKDLQSKYDQLLEKKKDLTKKIDEAKSQSKDKWENVKNSVKDVANDLEAKIDHLIDG